MSLEEAKRLDSQDDLSSLRNEFLFPQTHDGQDVLYFAGNSLGLQPKKVQEFVDQELKDWATFGVEGHFQAKNPWLPYHEFLAESTARMVGAKVDEVVVMNSLTVNLHLMMVSFYRPEPKRHKIIIESGAFPSDRYAVCSQIKFHGFDPKLSLIELSPRSGEKLLRSEDILQRIRDEGDSVALVMLGNVNYLTGQCYDFKSITEAGHAVGAKVGFDLAHGAGNLLLKLHDWNLDFAVWCSYKYVNAGPGAIAGCFVHERHARDYSIPRFSGWWSHNKSTRFAMGPDLDLMPGAEGWQLSNPPILQLAALRASMELFDKATMPKLRQKSEKLTAFLERELLKLPKESLEIISPKNPAERGCQLSIFFKKEPRELMKRLHSAGVFVDYREPGIIRMAPTPLYTRFSDVYRLVEILKNHVS